MFRLMEGQALAFDILQLNGQDLRSRPLITCKRHLRKLIPQTGSLLLYMDHVEERGVDLFRLACREDLEGIVAKWKDGHYDPNRVSSWIKIKYSQIVAGTNCFRSGQPDAFDCWQARRR